jgi:hypothetical protein
MAIEQKTTQVFGRQPASAPSFAGRERGVIIGYPHNNPKYENHVLTSKSIIEIYGLVD